MAYKTPKMALADMQGCYVGSTPARRWYDGGTLVYQGFSPASEQEFIEQTAAGGPAKLLKVYGKSVVWNQLIGSAQLSSGAVTRVDVTFTPSGEIYIVNGTANADASSFSLYFRFKQANGHKYYCKMIGLPSTTYLAASNHGGFTGHIDAGGIIVSCTQDGNNQNFSLNGLSQGMAFSNKKMRLIIHDLTLLYGAGNEPTTVAQFEADYPTYDPTYDPGSLQSNKTAELRAERVPIINLWDEEWEVGGFTASTGEPYPWTNRIRSINYIPVTPGSTLYIKGALLVYQYDSNANFISIKARQNTELVLESNCALIKFSTDPSAGAVTTYNHDICINLSDPAINGQYFSHWRGSLQLNLSTLTSGGVAVFPDGMRGAGSARDEAEGNTGVVRLGKRAYQAGDESDTSVLTDGTNTIYPLATPLTYVLDTPLPTDLTCEQGDILQRVSDNNCPFVGEMKFGL